MDIIVSTEIIFNNTVKNKKKRRGAMNYTFTELLSIQKTYFPGDLPDHETYINSYFYQKYILGNID